MSAIQMTLAFHSNKLLTGN